jgi:hypothetical protein
MLLWITKAQMRETRETNDVDDYVFKVIILSSYHNF